MGNAGGVFQADEVCVFATTLGCLRKLDRCSVAEAAVWPFFVVLLPPICDLDACIEQIPEPTHTQALFSESAVKALHMGVLDRLAGLDVAQVDLPLQGPGQEVTTGQFRAVVAADANRPAASCDDLIQHPGHPAAGEASIDFQSQTLPCRCRPHSTRGSSVRQPLRHGQNQAPTSG